MTANVENGTQYGTGTMYRTTKFNLANVKDFETLCYNRKGDVELTTSAMIWMLVEMGIPEITKKNIEQVMARCFLYQCVHRSSTVWNRDVKCWEWLTCKIIKEHIGLKVQTGCGDEKKTRVQFMKQLERSAIIRYGKKGRMEWRRLFE